MGTILKEVEILPREFPSHTYWFLRCVELEFAKAFTERGSVNLMGRAGEIFWKVHMPPKDAWTLVWTGFLKL